MHRDDDRRLREGKTGQVTSAIQTGITQGMIDMDASLRQLVEAKKITARSAYEKAIDKEIFKPSLDSP